MKWFAINLRHFFFYIRDFRRKLSLNVKARNQKRKKYYFINFYQLSVKFQLKLNFFSKINLEENKKTKNGWLS